MCDCRLGYISLFAGPNETASGSDILYDASVGVGDVTEDAGRDEAT